MDNFLVKLILSRLGALVVTIVVIVGIVYVLVIVPLGL